MGIKYFMNCIEAGKLPLKAGSAHRTAEIYQNDTEVYYVSQDNYYLADLDSGKNITYYCDSATSCIVIIAVGYSSRQHKHMAAISHLSRPNRFEKFFGIVEEYFKDEVSIYASGANPPSPCEKSNHEYDYTALKNAAQVAQWVFSGKITLHQASLKFGQGNPSIYTNNLDCYSIICSESGNLTVDNNRIYLTNEQRDPTGGVQTLFCMYGDPSVIRLQSDPFSKDEIETLVKSAKEHNLQQAADMSDEEILQTYSSTPKFEVPWFCDNIRQAGNYVKTY